MTVTGVFRDNNPFVTNDNVPAATKVVNLDFMNIQQQGVILGVK